MPEKVMSDSVLREPERPVVTKGSSKGDEAKDSLKSVFEIRYTNFVADYKRSFGNYICDLDGNSYLDVFQQIASLALGYNHPNLRKVAQSEDMIEALIDRPSTGRFPPAYYERTLKEGVLAASPKSQDKVWICLSGSDANDNAFKAAFMHQKSKIRGYSNPFTEEEIESTLAAKAPGNPDMAILSFQGGFHGRTIAPGSATFARAYHKVDLPAFDWPKAPFPELKFPYEDFEKENLQAEKKSLDAVEEIFKTWKCPIAATIIEPVLSEGGDLHASASFFQGLRDLTLKYNSLLIFDEVQTGLGATGKLWAHEHFNLTTPPDLVTFSKKFQTAGFYYHDPQIIPNDASRMFNTWVGDPARVLVAEGIVKTILQDDLVTKTKEVGDYLYPKILELSKKYPDLMMNVRGKDKGTFIAWDVPSGEFRAKFFKVALSNGLNIGGGFLRTVRLRPCLTFSKDHADLLMELLDKTFAQM